MSGAVNAQELLVLDPETLAEPRPTHGRSSADRRRIVAYTKSVASSNSSCISRRTFESFGSSCFERTIHIPDVIHEDRPHHGR